MTPGAKICEVCHEEFTPDPRVKNRQRVCQRLGCQLERKRQAQRAWVARNPGYFKQHYQDRKIDREKKRMDRKEQNSKDKLTYGKTIILNQASVRFLKDELTITIPHTNELMHLLGLWYKLHFNSNKTNRSRCKNSAFVLTVQDKIGFFLPFVFLLPTEFGTTGRRQDHG